MFVETHGVLTLIPPDPIFFFLTLVQVILSYLQAPN